MMSINKIRIVKYNKSESFYGYLHYVKLLLGELDLMIIMLYSLWEIN